MKINYIDLFSGIGGFAYGLQLAGIEFNEHYFSEIDKYAIKVYKKHYPRAKELGSITDVRGQKLIDLMFLDSSVRKCYDNQNINEWEVIMAGKLKKLTHQQLEESIKMYQSGMSLSDIGEYYSVSRQSIWDLLRRRITLRSNKKYGKENHFYRGGKSSDDNAQNILEIAIKKGIIQRKTHCEECGDTGTFKDGRTKIQAHHCDYNKPLEVIWLCQKCHHDWHKTNVPKKKETREASSICSAGFP